MLGGARRPRPVDEILLVCGLLTQAMKIGDRLRPFMREQVRLQQQRLYQQEVKDALRRVYGDEAAGSTSPNH